MLLLLSTHCGIHSYTETNAAFQLTFEVGTSVFFQLAMFKLEGEMPATNTNNFSSKFDLKNKQVFIFMM